VKYQQKTLSSLFNLAYSRVEMAAMRSTEHAAVVLHRKSPVTKQMQEDRLAWKVKNADIKMKRLCGRNGKYCAGDETCHQIDMKEVR
jgi:hypothetical protein